MPEIKIGNYIFSIKKDDTAVEWAKKHFEENHAGD